MDIKSPDYETIENLEEKLFQVFLLRDKLIKIQIPDKSIPKRLFMAAKNVEEVFHYHILGQFVCDSLYSLSEWEKNTPDIPCYIMRDMHCAERLIRNFLFDIRTCLDRMDVGIKNNYGEDSEIYNMFKVNTRKAYNNCNEYGFTYHLRNYVQHFNSIDFSFEQGSRKMLLDKTKLIVEDFNWKAYDIHFLQSEPEYISISDLFHKAYAAFTKALSPVINMFLQGKNVVEDILFLKEWGNNLSLFYQCDIHNIQFAIGMDKSGNYIPFEDGLAGELSFLVQLLDWDELLSIASGIT